MRTAPAPDFLRGHLAAHPGDAWTLGLPGAPDALVPPTLDVAAEEASRCRAALDAISAAGADLDADAVRRVALFYARHAEADRDAESLELAALPNAMLQHGALHARDDAAWDALAARAESVGPFLEAHADNLRRGAASGRAPDAAVVAAFVERVLPGAADAVASLPFAANAQRRAPAVVARVAEAARAASSSYRAFACVVASEVAPAARDDAVLGEEETLVRLRDVMGVEESVDELVGFARGELQRASAKLDRAELAAILARRPATLDDALAGYRRWLVEAQNFVRDRELVPAPPAMALALEPLPGGIADGGAVTNWPAPLFDPGGRGHVLYATDPAAHTTVAMKNLAVHEGIPGHYLQSVSWQRAADPRRAARFLGVADDVAFARGYFGTMIAVEGWAVYMERLLRRHGFYDQPEEQVFFDLCDAIRAMRVVLDLELHSGRLDGEGAVRFVAEATAMPEGWARAQVLRSKRIPLQSATYLLGAHAIEQLRRGFRGDDADFHARLLALGPVPASRAARALSSP